MSNRVLGFLFVIVLALPFGAFAFEIPGVYKGTADSEDRMLIVQEDGDSAYHFQYFRLDRIIPIGTAKPQLDGSYLLEADSAAVMRFEEGVCVLIDTEHDETQELQKLAGSAGTVEGAYEVDLPGVVQLVLMTVEKLGGELSVAMEGWETIVDSGSAASNKNHYKMSNAEDRLELKFKSDFCELTLNDKSLTLRMDQQVYVEHSPAAIGDLNSGEKK